MRRVSEPPQSFLKFEERPGVYRRTLARRGESPAPGERDADGIRLCRLGSILPIRRPRGARDVRLDSTRMVATRSLRLGLAGSFYRRRRRSAQCAGQDRPRSQRRDVGGPRSWPCAQQPGPPWRPRDPGDNGLSLLQLAALAMAALALSGGSVLATMAGWALMGLQGPAQCVYRAGVVHHVRHSTISPLDAIHAGPFDIGDHFAGMGTK
jgi:hypothetical protein